MTRVEVVIVVVVVVVVVGGGGSDTVQVFFVYIRHLCADKSYLLNVNGHGPSYQVVYSISSYTIVPQGIPFLTPIFHANE